MKKESIIRFIVSGMLCFASVFAEAQNVKIDQPWSVRMAESEMIRWPESWQLDFQPKLKWDYCHGLELQAMLDVYDRYGNKKFYDYALAYADTTVNADGTIKKYKLEEYSLDRVNSGKILFRIYEQTKDVKYKKALDLLRSQFDGQPRNADGGFWHKKVYPNQVWLDGVYMGAPFYAEYAYRNNEVDVYQDVVNQFLMAARHTYDPQTDLFKHACDVSREERWADSVTGRSLHSWGRAMGWYAMAFVERRGVTRCLWCSISWLRKSSACRMKKLVCGIRCWTRVASRAIIWSLPVRPCLSIRSSRRCAKGM